MSASVSSVPSSNMTMSASSQKFQSLGQTVSSRATAPTMTLGGSSAGLASRASGLKSGSFVPTAASAYPIYGAATTSRRAAPVMFAGNGRPSVMDAGFSIKSSQSASRAINRNYFDTKMNAGRRGDVKMMASYSVTLVTPDGEEKIECADDVFILDAAEEAGIELPYSCKAGACSSCAGKVTSGTVDNSEQTFLDEDQMAEGFILTCVAYPTSDCTIETHKEDDIF